jgi:hypothetical protein
MPFNVISKKDALDSQPQVIKLTSCLPMVGGSLQLLPPLKLVAMILLKVALLNGCFKPKEHYPSFSLNTTSNLGGVRVMVFNAT